MDINHRYPREDYIFTDQEKKDKFYLYNKKVTDGRSRISLQNVKRQEEETYRGLVHLNRQIILYLERMLRLIFPMEYDNRDVMILLFASDGTLLHMYGNQQTKEQYRRLGIEETVIWSPKQMGANAVTVGLGEKKSIVSIGKENYNQVLQDFAIYYCPLRVHEVERRDKILDYGGIAIMVPESSRNTFLVMLSNNLAHDLMLNACFSMTVDEMNMKATRGTLQIDSTLSMKGPIVIRTSKELFDILEIEPENFLYRPLQEMIDALPNNRPFWQLVQNPKNVDKVDMVLSLRGKKVSVTVSAREVYQPTLHMEGMIFSFTSRKAIAKSISNRIGNNAIKSFDNIIGVCDGIQEAIRKCERIAGAESNVMLLGESGVGKDVFAQAIHNASNRSQNPFIAINCGALSRDLIASELFGYDGGAFTGARKQGNIGKFELANGGTLFLDEIGELPLDLQAVLLRAVENKQIMRVGGNKNIDLDVRIISATNADIPEMIRQKRFRADLFYRLGRVQIRIPPLRDRGQDILLLAEHFVRVAGERSHRQEPMRLSDAARDLLLQMPWNGNVRELQNLMECIVELYPEPLILPEYILENSVGYHAEPQSYSHFHRPEGPQGYSDLKTSFQPAGFPERVAGGGYGSAFAGSGAVVPYPDPSGRMPIRHVELTREDLQNALAVCGNNKSAAARYLGISIRTLYRKLEKQGLLGGGKESL